MDNIIAQINQKIEQYKTEENCTKYLVIQDVGDLICNSEAKQMFVAEDALPGFIKVLEEWSTDMTATPLLAVTALGVLENMHICGSDIVKLNIGNALSDIVENHQGIPYAQLEAGNILDRIYRPAA